MVEFARADGSGAMHPRAKRVPKKKNLDFPAHERALASSRKPGSNNNSNNRVVEAVRRHASEVMRVLGKGHSERVYHRAMITSLNREQVPHRSEVIAPIYFMGEVVGFGRCDIIIGDLVVEFKANMWCPSKNSPQIRKYLESLTTTERARFRGLIVNFNQRSGKVEVHQEHRRSSSS